MNIILIQPETNGYLQIEMMWFLDGQHVRNSVARTLASDIGYDAAYDALSSTAYAILFNRVQQYPNHHSHTIESLYAQVVQFEKLRVQARESELRYKKENLQVNIADSSPCQSLFSRCDFSSSRLKDLSDSLEKIGISHCPNYQYVVDYVELALFIQKEEVVANVLFGSSWFSQRLVHMVYVGNMGWIEAAQFLSDREAHRKKTIPLPTHENQQDVVSEFGSDLESLEDEYGFGYLSSENDNGALFN